MLEGCSTARQSGHYYHLVGDRFFAEMPACLRSGQIEATYALEDADGHRAFGQTERTVSGIKIPPLLVGLLSLRDGRQKGEKSAGCDKRNGRWRADLPELFYLCPHELMNDWI